MLATTSCQEKSNSSTPQMSEVDSAKIAFYDKYFGQEGFVPNVENRPVDPEIAQKCVALYDSISGKMDPKELKQMLITRSVSFDTRDLTHWMQDTLKGVDYDNMRICLGVYNDEAIQNGGKPKGETGRLTVYLWPYLGDNEALIPTKDAQGGKVKPFNLGTLNP